MKFVIEPLIALLATLSMMSPVSAGSPPKPSSWLRTVAVVDQKGQFPQKRRLASIGIETSSRSAFVADIGTGKVLYSKNPYEVMPIASLTKLMTAMVLLDAKMNMDQMIVFADEDLDTESKAIFKPGEAITRRDALRAMLVGSVNAAAHLLARTSLGNQEFVKAMNEKAKALRLASPVFVEPTGLDPKDRSNAADVAAMLGTALSYPDIRAFASLPSVSIKTQEGKIREIKSTNLLLGSYLNKKPYQIVAAKTGSLPEAGFCMAQVTRNPQGHEIVVASLDSSDHFTRYQDVKALTAWTFDSYQWDR